MSAPKGLLFSVPSHKDNIAAIFFSGILLFISLIIFLISSLIESTFFYWSYTALLISHLILAVHTCKLNVLYLARYFLVWILIFLASIIFAIYEGRVYLHYLGLMYQTNEATKILVFAGYISLCGSLLGWHFSLYSINPAQSVNILLQKREWRFCRDLGLILTIMFSLGYFFAAGGMVTADSGYSGKGAGGSIKFGIYNIMHLLGMALLVLYTFRFRRKAKLVSVFLFVSFLPGVLSGSRADFLLPMLFALLLFSNSLSKNLGEKISLIRYVWLFCIFVAILVGFYILASVLALWRIGGINIFQAYSNFVAVGGLSPVMQVGGVEVLWLETGNHIIGGLYSAIYQTSKSWTDFLFGSSYMGFLLNIPPAFFGLPRVPGLEGRTEIDGEIISQGGIFEVAEAYWNFGFLGCFLVPFIISFLIGKILRKGIEQGTIFFLAFYLVFGFIGLRAVWYQNFTYFRLVTVMAVFFCVSYVFFRYVISPTHKRRLKPVKRCVYNG